MFAEHFHHAAIVREVIVVRNYFFGGDAIGRLEYGSKAVGRCFIGAHEAEISRVLVQLDHIAQQVAHHAGGFRFHGAGMGYGYRIVAKVGQAEVLEQQTAVSVGVRAHAKVPGGSQFRQFGN